MGKSLGTSLLSLSYADAVSHCAAYGLVLCKSSCDGTGCGYGKHPVFTSRPCRDVSANAARDSTSSHVVALLIFAPFFACFLAGVGYVLLSRWRRGAAALSVAHRKGIKMDAAIFSSTGGGENGNKKQGKSLLHLGALEDVEDEPQVRVAEDGKRATCTRGISNVGVELKSSAI